MKVSKFLKVSAIAYVIALLTYFNSFIAAQEEFHSNVLASIALLAMFFNLGQTVVCYGYNGYIVYLKKSSDISNNFKELINKVKIGVLINATLFIIGINIWGGYNLEETISYLFISMLGMISGFIACGFYALGKSNLAIVIEKCNVVSITISLFLVIVGWQENVTRMSVIIASIFVFFALFKLISTLSISNSSTANIKNEYYNGKFLFYNSVNALCSYLFLFLDQWIISTTKESGLYLGVYFLAIQIINFLKYTQTQTSKLLLASITRVSDEYFRTITLVYMSITTLVILIVLPFKYIDLGLNSRLYFSYDNIDLIVYFVTMTTLGVVYNQFLIFLGDVKDLTKCNLYIFSSYLILLLIYIFVNESIELRDLLLIKCISGFIGQLVLLKRITVISQVKGDSYFLFYFLNTISLITCIILNEKIYVEISVVMMLIFIINLKKKIYVEHNRNIN